MTDIEQLVRDKYNGDSSKVSAKDKERLAAGEPLAYVIGWVPFLGLHIDLSSRPLIPRPETEWWTEQLIAHLRERYGERPFKLLDLCAGSGAIGIAVLKEFPYAYVSFGEIDPEHCELIKKNITANKIDSNRADVRTTNLFRAFRKPTGETERFDILVTNPPYVPAGRELEASVSTHEPNIALFSGPEGLDHIERIAIRAEEYLYPGGELWIECDISNIHTAAKLVQQSGSEPPVILIDQYGRERVVMAYFP